MGYLYSFSILEQTLTSEQIFIQNFVELEHGELMSSVLREYLEYERRELGRRG